MPYIENDRREALTPKSTKTPIFAGELNFQITKLIKDYVKLNSMCYQTINDVVGALEGAKLEFYRRQAVPYEQLKISENGDVYE